MNRLLQGTLVALALTVFGASSASAALYTSDFGNLQQTKVVKNGKVVQKSFFTSTFGTVQPNSSNCDDCFDGPVAFPGTGQSIQFFGGSYTGLYVGSNGYVTFGSGQTEYVSEPLNIQTVGKMIAGEFTDLDSRNDAQSNVYVNNSTPGQLVITWQLMGHFPEIYSVRSTFQIVVRSDQFAVPAGEGQIGFFFDTITDPNTASAGFGDGLAAVNPGEVSLYSGPANQFSNHAPVWFSLSGGVPVTQPTLPVPTLTEWGLALLAGLMAIASGFALRRRSRVTAA